MEITFWPGVMNMDRAFMDVVLPDAVPPATSKANLFSTRYQR